MSSITESKTATEVLFEHGIEMTDNDTFNCQLLNAMERYAESKAALQNKVSDEGPNKGDIIKEAKKLWNIPNKLEAVKLIIKLGYSLKDAKAYCEDNFDRKVGDVSAEEESEFELLLKVKNELFKADELPFSERVEANKEILNFVSIKRKPIVNERKDNVGVWIETNKMPDFDGPYQCYIIRNNECGTVSNYQEVVQCICNNWVVKDREIVTHWMPLPAPPESQPQQKEVDEDEIYDSIYMEVVELVEKDNIQCELYKETAEKLKSKYLITRK